MTRVNELVEPRVLREYAFIADGERGALVAPDGTIAWMCAPRWDSPAVFAQLLGGAGRYSVTPARLLACLGRVLRGRQPDLAEQVDRRICD